MLIILSIPRITTQTIIMKNYLLAVISLFFLLVGCSGEEELISSGSFSLSMKMDSSRISATFQKSTIAPEDFCVDILQNETVVKHFQRYADMPSQVELPLGDYIIKAYRGTPAIASFSGEYFLGKSTFAIKPAQRTAIDLICYSGDVKISAIYTEKFKEVFSDYSVTITSVNSNKSILFEKDDARIGYFAPGDISMVMHVTKAIGGKSFDINLPTQKNLQPRDFLKLTFDVDPNTLNGDVVVSIITDESTNDKNISIDIPGDFVPKAAPVVKTSSAIPSSAFLEGTECPYSVQIEALNGLKDLVIEFTSPDLISIFGGVPISLANVSPEILQKLSQYGVSWTNNFVGSEFASINFGTLLSELLGGAAGNVVHAIKVIAVDKLGLSGNLSNSFEIMPAIFTLNEPSAADVWSKTIYTSGNVTAGDINRYTLELSADGGKTWRSINADKAIAGSDISITVGSLDSGTAYLLRAAIGKRKGEPVRFTTESIIELPNKSFDSWHFYQPTGVKYWEVWKPWDEAIPDTKGWDTLNEKTTSEGGTSEGAFNSGRNAYRYNANSGTLSTTDSHTPNKPAALIRTVGWGKGNNAASLKNAKYVDPGCLYLGKYNSTTKLPDYGYAFCSRPTKFKFFYKYTPGVDGVNDTFTAKIVLQNRSNGSVDIGSATFTSDVATTAYTEKLLDIVYDPAYKNLKATHIYVLFKSGNFTSNNSLLVVPAFGNLSTGEYIGSQLYIDDLSLIYEK